MLNNFKTLGCHVIIKVHLTLPYFLEDTSEKQGEKFHQDIKTMQDRHQVRWNSCFMADYYWSFKQDSIFMNSWNNGGKFVDHIS